MPLLQASQLERCLEPTGGLVMQLSLEPARNLFGRYVTSVQAQGMQDAAFLSPGNLTSERLFYVLFALGSCGRSPAGGGRGNAHINATLRESPQFAEAWDCRPRSAMSPRQRCLPPTAAA